MSASDVAAIEKFLVQGPPAPANVAPAMMAGAASTSVLCVIAVVLRLVARRIRRMRLEADDFMVLVSLVSGH